MAWPYPCLGAHTAACGGFISSGCSRHPLLQEHGLPSGEGSQALCSPGRLWLSSLTGSKPHHTRSSAQRWAEPRTQVQTPTASQGKHQTTRHLCSQQEQPALLQPECSTGLRFHSPDPLGQTLRCLNLQSSYSIWWLLGRSGVGPFGGGRHQAWGICAF